jgi:menaquinone-9 beta-reductase
MPTRATKRGADRTLLHQVRDCDVLVCGASFAGLAVARELAGSGMRVLVIDRYELGERQTSACAMPTLWLEAMDLLGCLRQTFGELVVHTPYRRGMRWQLPW